MIGKVFGRLTVQELAGRGESGDLLWECSCSCSGTKTTTGAALRKGYTQSCGCLKKENLPQPNPIIKTPGKLRKPPGPTRKEDCGYYAVDSTQHSNALTAAGISFAL